MYCKSNLKYYSYYYYFFIVENFKTSCQFYSENFLGVELDISVMNMLDKERVRIDVLDVFCVAKRGLSIADVLMQLNSMYVRSGEKLEQQMLQDVLDELTEKGYLKTYKVGILSSWKITEEGIEYFEDM
ncbi:hypothetical protein ES705_30635 [subsurface metagenome]